MTGIDGREVGQRMAINLMSDVFSAMAVDFAARDRENALASLARIELSIADAIADFREQSGKGTVAYDEAFAAMVETISTFVEGARDAVQALGDKPKD